MLTHEQTEDLAELEAVAEQHGAEVVIIGAAALLCFVDLGRFTRDVDLVISLDLDGFTAFSSSLAARGWLQEPGNEHRWRAARGSIIDVMPAGPKLRAARQVTWPRSQLVMSLAGFDHVFARSAPIEFSPEVSLKVAPASVVALLKIVAYLDDPYQRQKDLEDLKLLFRRYEEGSDRLFGEPVLAAELEDFGDASAFLLGMDIGMFAVDEEDIVREFLRTSTIPAAEQAELESGDRRQSETIQFQAALKAFAKGFEMAR